MTLYAKDKAVWEYPNQVIFDDETVFFLGIDCAKMIQLIHLYSVAPFTNMV